MKIKIIFEGYCLKSFLSLADLSVMDYGIAAFSIVGIIVNMKLFTKFVLPLVFQSGMNYSQGCYDPVSRPVPRDGIRDGTGFFKAFLKKPVLQNFFFQK